jgi:hypothetical protein
MSRHIWATQAPLDGWLAKLAVGWRLPDVVEPIGAYEMVRGEFVPAVNHGAYAILLTREDDPLAQSNTGRAMRPVSPGASPRRACSLPEGDSGRARTSAVRGAARKDCPAPGHLFRGEAP